MKKREIGFEPSDVARTGNDDPLSREPAEELARLRELTRAAALGQVPAHDDHVGTERGQVSEDRVGESALESPEPQIREMCDRGQLPALTRALG